MNRPPAPASAVALIARATLLDFVRRKDLLVAAILMGLFAVAAGAVRRVGVEGTDAARFLLDGGITLARLLAAILAAVLAARLFPEEFERGTLMPLLAKPVTRLQVLLGKFLAAAATACAAYLAFLALVLAAVPPGAGGSPLALAQVALLHCTGLALVAALALLPSLWLPALPSALLALGWHFAAGFLLGAVRALLASTAAGPLFPRIAALVPDPSLLTHTQTFTSGSPALSASLFAALLLYGLGWTALLLLAAAARFQRMRL